MAVPPATMRAWLCPAYNEDPAKAIASLKLVDDVPVPVPGPGQVLVRVHFAAANPIDWKLFTGHMHGMFPITKFPYVPGFDIAGVVAALGDGVTRVKVGDRVAADIGLVESCTAETTFGPAGAYAEYSVVPETLVSLVPEGLPLSSAAAIPLAGLTSYQALFTSGSASLKGEPLGQVGEGTKALVLGGASGTGHLAVQLAKIRGATVATTASPNTLADGRSKVEWMKSLGADVVVNYKEQDWAEELKGQDYDLIFDCVGAEEDWAKAAGVLKTGGQFITIVRFEPTESTAEHAYKQCMVRSSRTDLDQMLAWASEGRLSVYVEQVFSFGEVPKALQHNLEGRATGKLVVNVLGE